MSNRLDAFRFSAFLASFLLVAGASGPVLAQESGGDPAPQTSASITSESSAGEDATSGSDAGGEAASGDVTATTADSGPAEPATEDGAAAVARTAAAATSPSSGTNVTSAGNASVPGAAQLTQTSSGDLAYTIAFRIPGFRGLEPGLGLAYRTRNAMHRSAWDWTGNGWRLTGFSEISLISEKRGLPIFDPAQDVYMLDGVELLRCADAVNSPGCLPDSGNRKYWAAEYETFHRIEQDTGSNTWTVTDRNGTRRIYQPIATWRGTPPSGQDEERQLEQSRFLIEKIVDTNGNEVNFDYGVEGAANGFATRPTRITYNGTTITFHYVDRSAPVLYANGVKIARIVKQLSAVEVERITDDQGGKTGVRAYSLTYGAGAVTGTLLLTRVQEYGFNYTITNGEVTGGAALPPTLPRYTTDDGITWSDEAAPVESAVVDFGMLAQIADVDLDGRDEILRPKWQICDPSGVLHDCLPVPISNIARLWEVGSGQTITREDYPDDPFQGDYRTTPDASGNVFHQVRFRIGDFTSGRDDLEGIQTNLRTGSPTPELGVATFGPVTENGAPKLSGGMMPFPIGPVPDIENYQHYGDYDGDGAVEILLGDDVGPMEMKRMLSGGSFAAVPLGGDIPDTGKALILDVNGDGKSDLVRGTATDSSIFRSTATAGAMQFEQMAVDGIPSWEKLMPQGIPGDFNGDGATDIAVIQQARLVKVLLSTGNGFVHQLWADTNGETGIRDFFDTLATDESGTDNLSAFSRSGDLNGDGLADILIAAVPASPNQLYCNGGARGDGVIAPTVYAFLSTGSGFVYAGESVDNFAGIGDFNGDGKADPLTADDPRCAPQANANRLHLSTGPVPNLLDEVENPIGGKMMATYAPSSAWVTPHRLPRVYQTVSSISFDDGRGTVSLRSFDYEGAEFDYPHRRFKGYERITATLPAVSGGGGSPTVETRYLQDIEAIGRPESIARRDGSGQELHRRDYTYNRKSTRPYRALRTETEERYFFEEPGPNNSTIWTESMRTTQRSYDAYGQVASVVEPGGPSALDDRATRTQYVYNTTAYIVSRPRQRRVYIGTSTTDPADIRDGEFYSYDGGALGDAPTKGNLTKVEEWESGGGFTRRLLRQMTYDQYGNLTSRENAVGGRTDYTYEPLFNLYEASRSERISTAPGDTLDYATSWNPRCAMPSRAFDQNGQATVYTYDGPVVKVLDFS